MSTSLWPALLAAVLGGRQHQHQQQQQEEQQMMMQQERALHPIQALLYLSVLGEHALYWWIGIVCFVGLAYATNPSEASFKTHLTDLSFHLHLRRLRAQDPDSLHGSSGNSSTLPGDFRRSSTSASPSGGHSIASSASSATKEVLTSTAGSTNIAGAKINSNATTGGGKSKNTNINNVVNHQAGNSASIEIKQRNVSSSNKQRISPHNHSNGGGAGGVESGRPHVLSFSNRVSISLKTPAYVRTSYALWSTVRILPATPSSSSSSSQSPSASSAKAVGGGSKGSNTTATAGTPGRPILNGVPAVTRRASTTLSSLNERSSKKSSSTSSSGSSSSSSLSSLKNANSRKGKGLVSTVAHGISASLASPVCSPWLEQGGYFIGFLGYWWTVDDGTSFSGAREKLRLGNALLAVEEQDEEDDVSVDQHGPEAARNADDLEGGHSFYDTGHAHSQVARAEDQSNSAQQHMNGSSSNTTTSKRKQQQQQQPSKASHGASMRGGQRRSSPTPRPASNKKRGSGSGAATAASGGSAQASQVNSSGDVTPITPHSTVPLDRSRLEREGHHLLSTNDDSQLPGLPFHVDRISRDGVNSHAAAAQQDHRQFATVKEGGVNVASGDIVGVDGQTLQGVTFKEGEDGISTISHSASGPESTVATVSPALALLQSQLDDLRTSSAATQARLEAEVEELQIRKRDEDAVRTELKARTKILEESKREAELERLDAEKKLISARSVKKSVEDRVTKARSELSKLEKKEKEVQEKIQRAREERRIKLDSLREDVKKREALLVKEEEATEKLNKRVADLEKEIEERKHDLFQFRREEANAAAVAVTNRMNRAGRGLGPGPHPHTHGHGPHSGAAVTAKRQMHPPPHAHTTAHRHPSQHPNAAVPVAYPYISPEDQAKQSGNQARSSSPGATTPPPPSSQTPATTATGSAANAAQGASSNVEGGQTFGSAFMDHRLQSRRAASAAGTLGGQASAAGANQPVRSNVNTSVIGNSASAAGGLYNRHQLDRGEEDGNELDDLEDNDGEDHDYEATNLVPGSTFAPFGPASPTSPSTIGAPSPREQHGRLNASPGLAHIPYFASDKSLHQASQQPQNRLRMSTSIEDFLAAMRSEVVEEDDDHDHHPRELDTTPVMRLASELAEDETDSYVLAKPRAITASGRREAGGRTGGLRRESFDSVGSFTSSNGGPLSPMTPHQASLIPSQLFDMLDDVEMPASPTPFQVAGGMQDPHHTFTQGISDAFDHAGNNDNLQPHQAAGAGGASRRGPGMYSPWADFDIDAGFDFDKPLGYGASASAGVSRKPSGKDGLAHHADLLRRRSGSPIGSGAFDATTSSGAVNSGEGIFASYGPTHGHHGSVGSTGQRSNTSSSGGSISPSLMAATQGHQQQQHQQHSVGNSAMNFPAGFGKLSPNDLLFDKARHVLSLNPDAKAFSFNRPLPSSGSAGSLSSIGGGSKHGGHNLPSNAVGAIGDARLAFDNAGAGSQISSGSGSDSPKLVNNSIAPGNATWASPNLTNRGLHNLGYGTGNTGSSGGNTLRESVRSASGPPLTNPTSSTGHSSSFSPFDDDDLLKGW